MSEEIVNRVVNSSLVTIDLESLYPKGDRVELDISKWLAEGLVLIEKDFRASIKMQDWSQYQDKYIALNCSTEAIVPAWAYMLVSVVLADIAKKVVIGSLIDLETVLFAEIINDLDLSEYKDQRVIVKGCSNRPVPENAYILLTQKLQPLVKSIMYGEACSSVPLYKKK